MKHLILDLDTGIDDSMALALSLSTNNIDLLGVIATYGNVTMENSAFNTRFMLQKFGSGTIPVFRGLSHALIQPDFRRQAVSARIHGEDGLGNLNPPVDRVTVIEGIWESFLSEQIQKYGKELFYVTTGPMTNLASFIARFPEEAGNLGGIVSMGGALLYPGNINEGAEANISQDPEAGKIVMESGLPFTLVPLDVTMKSRITLQMSAEWKKSQRKGIPFLGEMVDYYISQHPGKQECYVHDPSAVMYLIHPEYFTVIHRYATVLVDGPCRARVVGDVSRIRQQDVNTTLCLDVDADALVFTLNKGFLGE